MNGQSGTAAVIQSGETGNNINYNGNIINQGTLNNSAATNDIHNYNGAVNNSTAGNNIYNNGGTVTNSQAGNNIYNNSGSVSYSIAGNNIINNNNGSISNSIAGNSIINSYGTVSKSLADVNIFNNYGTVSNSIAGNSIININGMVINSISYRKSTSNIIGNGIGGSNSDKIIDKYSNMSNKEIRSQLLNLRIQKKVDLALVVAQFSQISNQNILRAFESMKALTNDKLELVYYKSAYYVTIAKESKTARTKPTGTALLRDLAASSQKLTITDKPAGEGAFESYKWSTSYEGLLVDKINGIPSNSTIHIGDTLSSVYEAIIDKKTGITSYVENTASFKIVLGHELIHAIHHMTGTYTSGYATYDSHLDGIVRESAEEVITSGFDYTYGSKKYYAFELPYSENSLRRELGDPQRALYNR